MPHTYRFLTSLLGQLSSSMGFFFLGRLYDRGRSILDAPIPRLGFRRQFIAIGRCTYFES